MAEKYKSENVDLDAINKKLNDLEAKVRRLVKRDQDKSDNWKKFADVFIGDHDDGKVGSASIWQTVATAVVGLCLCAVPMFAATVVQWSSDPGYLGGYQNLKSVDGVSYVEVIGGEGDDAVLILDADEGDDTADTWTIESEATGNDLSILNGTTERLNLTSAGVLTVAAGIVAPISGAVSASTISASGKTTLSGELEVNDSDVDINLTGTTDEIAITQTNTTGASGVPMMSIDDDRTGTFADAAAEATLVITAAGAYGLSVADGIVNVEGEIDSTGDITLDPAGNDVICDATVDATAYTADASAGLDTKTAGALELGTTTATSVNVGVSGGATTVKGTLNVDEAATFDTTVGITGSLTVNGASILGDGSTTATNIDIYYAKTSFEGPVGVAVPAAGDFTTIGAGTPGSGEFTTIGASDVITSSDTTVSSSKDTGAFVTEGGIGVEEDVYAGGQIVAVGNIDAASFSVSAAPGLTTNIVITTASGSITNTFSFTAGILTGYTVAP